MSESYYYLFAFLAVIAVCVNVCLLADRNSKQKQSSNKRNYTKNERIMFNLYRQGKISRQQLARLQAMTDSEQSRQLLQLMQQMQWNQQFMEQMQQDMQTANNMATGVEFGGTNPDPNLNPGMQHMMDQMNNFNNFGNPNMF